MNSPFPVFFFLYLFFLKWSCLLGNKSSKKSKNYSHQCSSSCNDEKFENCTENIRCIYRTIRHFQERFVDFSSFFNLPKSKSHEKIVKILEIERILLKKLVPLYKTTATPSLRRDSPFMKRRRRLPLSRALRKLLMGT